MCMYTYSIIIPHKNIPKLLQRCLDSIPRREDTQIIVVDDNSDPAKVDFTHFPDLSDPSVEVYFDKSGKGAGRARNIGLEHAKGKWLVFADADDYFYPNAFDVIDEKIAEADYDIIYFYCNSRDGETGELIEDRVSTIKQGIEEKNYDLLRYRSYVPWGKVVNSNLINSYGIKFDEVEVSNDVMFSALVGYYSKKIGIISQCLYCCTRNQGSLVFTQSITRIKKRLIVARRVNDFLYKKNIVGYHVPTEPLVILFFPRHPIMFIWGFFYGVYKDDRKNYFLEMSKRLYEGILGRILRRNLFTSRI